MTRIPCLVCKKPYDGRNHCSVNACTACAMFFKRFANLKVLPKCRTGRNNCRLDKAGNITCSACRYIKCVEAGMKRKKNIRSLTNQQENFDRNIQDRRLIIQAQLLVADTMPIMNRFCHFYAQYSQDKKANEHALLLAEQVKTMKLPGNRFMGKITYSLIEKILPLEIGQLGKFMLKTFPAFSTLEHKCQEIVMYRSMYFLFELSASFRSLRVLNDLHCNKVLCTETTYADISDLTDFIEPSMFSNLMDYKTILSFVATYWSGFLNSTHRQMHQMKITDMEFLAVCALVIWDRDNFCNNPHWSFVAEQHRHLVYKDLDYYYKQNTTILTNKLGSSCEFQKSCYNCFFVEYTIETSHQK